MRTCSACGEAKPAGDFYKGRTAKCKPCYNQTVKDWRQRNPEKCREYGRRDKAKNPSRHRMYRLAAYGLTEEAFASLLSSQDGRCAICGTDEPGGRNGQWHIDHDHSCCPGEGSCGGCVRGLLCWNCNAGVGLFRDDVARLERAITYLRGELG